MKTLLLTNPRMGGSDVFELQKRLISFGLNVGPIDGVFGSATDRAVREFQESIGLEVDGVVGNFTWEALKNVPLSPLTPVSDKRVGSKIGVLALSESLKHLDYLEEPPGSNKNKFGKWHGFDGVAWCSQFVSYCFKVGAGYQICKGIKAPGVYNDRGCSYVPTVEAWLRSSDQWVGKADPLSGDICIFQFDKDPEGDHIGIVERNIGNGHFYCIEGNVGSAVKRMDRNVKQIKGFGRIKDQ